VTSSTGRQFLAPTPLTPRSADEHAAALWPHWASVTLCLLTLGLLATLLSLIPPVSHLAWAGVPLLLVGGWFLWTVTRHPPTDDGPAQEVFLLYWNTWAWLLLSVSTGVLRRVRHAGRESWAQSLGVGLLWAGLPSPILTVSALSALGGVADFSPQLPAMLVLWALLLGLLAWGQRLILVRPALRRRGHP